MTPFAFSRLWTQSLSFDRLISLHRVAENSSISFQVAPEKYRETDEGTLIAQPNNDIARLNASGENTIENQESQVTIDILTSRSESTIFDAGNGYVLIEGDITNTSDSDRVSMKSDAGTSVTIAFKMASKVTLQSIPSIKFGNASSGVIDTTAHSVYSQPPPKLPIDFPRKPSIDLNEMIPDDNTLFTPSLKSESLIDILQDNHRSKPIVRDYLKTVSL